MTSLQDHLHSEATRYAAARGWSLARLSTKAVDSGSFFRRLGDGKTFNVRIYEAFFDYFAANPVEGFEVGPRYPQSPDAPVDEAKAPTTMEVAQ